MLESSIWRSARFTRGRRLAGLLLLVALPMLLGAGCTWTTTVAITSAHYDLTGLAVFGQRNLLLDNATVTINGPDYRKVYTNVDGAFSAPNLTEGTYTVTVNSLAGSVSQKVYLTRDTDVTVRVPYPVGFSEKLFLDISGLWDYHVDDSNNLVTTKGSGNWRWRMGINVPIFVNPDGLPADSTWPDDVWTYIQHWPDIANNKLTTSRVYAAPVNSGIEVQWVPAGTLGGGQVGSATVLAFDGNGYMKSVLVAVDMQYGDILASPTLGHEVLHAIGANHVEDANSVLYPFVDPSNHNQRIVLSTTESNYLTYAFAIAPNQSVGVLGTAAASLETESLRAVRVPGRSVITVLNRPGKPAEVVNGVPDFLLKHPKLQKRLAHLATKSQGSGGFLWDEVGK